MMTPEEHELILAMLARQAMAIRTLEEVLRSKELLTDKSLQGAQDSVEFSESENPKTIPQMKELYLRTAKKLNVGSLAKPPE